MKKELNENSVRVIKISKEALFEFIYEKFIDDEELFFDIDLSDVTSTFDIILREGSLFAVFTNPKMLMERFLNFQKRLIYSNSWRTFQILRQQCLLIADTKNSPREN